MYSHHRAELRLAETNRLLDQFRSGPVAASWARLGAAWQAEGARQEALLAQLASHDGNDRARIRRDHQLFVLETIEEYRLAPDIEVVRQFVIRLATCVRVGSCDRTVAAAQLGPKLWAFRDQHRHYFQFEYSGVELDSHLRTIAPRPAAPPARGADSTGAGRSGPPGRELPRRASPVMAGRGGADASGGRSRRAS